MNREQAVLHAVNNNGGGSAMKVYEEPKLEVQEFTVEDVITESMGEIILPDEEIE